MRSSKSRSRSKSNRNRSSVGNIVNRVFDSSGPEGKVRGTPQQIIEKYNQLARDAQLSNDRVATENFQQHAEHYTRLMGEALRDAEAKREQQEQQNRDRQQRDRDEPRHNPQPTQGENRGEDTGDRPRDDAAQDNGSNGNNGNSNAAAAEPQNTSSNEVLDLAPAGSEDSGLVETPESAPAKPKPKPRRARKPKVKEPKDAAPSEAAPSDAAPKGGAANDAGDGTSAPAVETDAPTKVAE
ncbi:DUF4167 domain-containing protein [Fluviibacterium sp. DFM31]|uniref:DUF4167 domain-containing protein n=1 Tax=Meridianimarinicoccus marinus TaxID=3231483 RepID=A0ABV3L1F3_9RHOB